MSCKTSCFSSRCSFYTYDAKFFILDNFVNYAYGPNINIFIGTPKYIENNLNKIEQIKIML